MLLGSATALAFLGFRRAGAAGLLETLPGVPAFAPLSRDPAGLFELPRGFSYRVIARAGEVMDDGLLLPGDPDGMAAFPAPGSRVVLICNHELDFAETARSPFGAGQERLDRLDRSRLFDAGRGTPCPGGTSTHVYDPAAGTIERSFLSLAGTERNCSGGPTPWGSWLSCEETVARADHLHTRDHGWVFEVPAGTGELTTPVPLRAMGRFNHEACAVDPATGIVYQTEDRPDGLFYRFLPERPGELAAGGRLQALVLSGVPAADTRNWNRQEGFRMPAGRSLSVEWIDLEEIESPDDDLRRRGHADGAAVFARGEGLWYGHGEVYFAATGGGAGGLGQIFRLTPDPAGDRLELFVESGHERLMKRCDNLTVTPWGDLLVCEDRPDGASLIGVTPQGDLYEFARNVGSSSELAGACFSPDGRTLFVNLQDDGLTLAITGPFPG